MRFLDSITDGQSDTARLEQRNRELSILNAIAEALNREVDLSQAIQAVLARVAELFGLQTGWIWLLDEESGAPYLAASQNLPPALASNPRRMAGGCYCLDSFRAGDLDGAANINVITCSRLHPLMRGTDGLRYHASIPLTAHDKPLGVLNVASADWREPSPDELRLLHTVGDLLSIAIERARLFGHSARLGAFEERNRLAREIHDTLAQSLAAITLRLETADALLESGEREQIHQAIQAALSLTHSSLDEARRSVMDLRAADLEGRTLAEGLSALAAEWSAQTGVEIAVEITGGVAPLSLRIESGLYRIAQEALTNVQRHAEAHQVRLALIATPRQVSLVVVDDGRGFDPQQIPRGRYGLIGLRERVRLLGGALHLRSEQSAPGSGTSLTVIIPLEESQ